MDKAEYRIKLEQINSLAEAGDFKGAAAVVDTIDWRHVKSVRTLCMVGEIYEANKRYEDSKRILLYAYKRSSISKTVLYRLAEINIRLGDYDSAKRYYNEFEQLSPHDTSRFILKYKLLRAEGATLDDQIAVLKEYKEREYTERWAYELAKLYMKNGQTQKCVEECDEMILWFAEGKFVTRAMELKMQVRALSDSQKKKYEDRHNAAEKEKNEKEIQESSLTTEALISKAADYAVDDEEQKHEEAKKKMTSIDAIRKMEAAADETVSSALSGSRPNVTPGLRPVRDPMYHSHTSIDYEGLERTGKDRRAVNPAYQNEAIKAAEKAFKQIKSLVDEPTESGQSEAEVEAIRDIETAAGSAVESIEQEVEAAIEDINSTDVKQAEDIAAAAAEVDAEAETAKAAEAEDQSDEEAENESAEAAESEVQSDAEAEMAEAAESEAQSDEEAEAETAEAESEVQPDEEAETAEAAESEAQSDAEAETAEAAESEVQSDAEAEAEAAESEAQSDAEAETAEAESEAQSDAEAETAEAESEAQSDAEAEAEAAESEAQSDEEAENETAEVQSDEEAETAEAAEEEAQSDADAEDEMEEEADQEEAPAAHTPEEIAKDAEEEAQKALQEMMASFRSEFETSGKEYHMVSEVLPEEEEEEPAEEEDSDDEKLRMLGKETDESLGLTRTQSFQEMLKKALEEGGNYEEANQIIIGEGEIQSPEEAAKRTVMEANGLTYDPEAEDAADTEADADDNEDADSENQTDAEEAGADESDTDTEVEKEDGADSDSEAENADEIDGEAEEDDTDSEADSIEGDADSSLKAEDEEKSGIESEEDSDKAADEEAEEAESDAEPAEEIVKEPEIFERVEVLPRPFTEDEKTIFTYFCDIPGVSEQVTLALADIHNNAGDKTSKSGNVLIMGRQVSGKTRLAEGLVRAVCLDLKIKTVKIAKVIGEDLNEKEPSDIVEQMAGGFLVIEGAGSLSDEFVEKLNQAMEQNTDSLVIILEDEKSDLMEMLQKHPSFEKKFTSTIIVPVFTNDELVTFARTYAKEKGYKFDEMGTLALYTMIGENQKEDEPVVVGKVKKMVDKAIERSKGSKLTARFRKNQIAEDGRILLKERDFRF